MKKSTRNLSIAVLASVLLLLGIGIFGGSGPDGIEWQPASFYAAVAQGGATNSLYA